MRFRVPSSASSMNHTRGLGSATVSKVWGRLLRFSKNAAVFVVCLVAGILFIGLTNIHKPWFGDTFNAAILATSVILPTVAPLLLLMSAVAAIIVWWRRKKLTTALSALVAIAATTLVSCLGIGVAAIREGISLNVARALVPSSMDNPPTKTISDGYGNRVDLWESGSQSVKPLIVDIHGGGWSEDAQMQATLQWFANHGWIVARPQYPLVKPNAVEKNEVDTAATWNTAPQSIRRSYTWLIQHADLVGADSTRVVLFGDSAGGGLAINLGAQLAQQNPEMAPRAIVAMYPTVDVVAVSRVRTLAAGQAAINFTGGTPEEQPERYRAVNSKTWITPDMPATLIIQGLHDTFVPPQSVQDYVADANRAAKNDTPISYFSVPFANHAFDSQARDSLGFQLVTASAEKFFETHLQMKSPGD